MPDEIDVYFKDALQLKREESKSDQAYPKTEATAAEIEVAANELRRVLKSVFARAELKVTASVVEKTGVHSQNISISIPGKLNTVLTCETQGTHTHCHSLVNEREFRADSIAEFKRGLSDFIVDLV